MKTNIEDITGVKKKLNVEIEADEIDRRIDTAYKSLAKNARIPGFRPGKIPRKILENYYGSQLLEDLARDLVAETLPTAVEETKTYPVAAPAIEKESLKGGRDFRYSAIMEVRPQFELKDYMGLEVMKEKVLVADEDVDGQLEQIRMSRGDLISLEEDRGVQENDYVLLNYEAFEDGKALEGIKADNYMLKVGSGNFHPDFEKALIGRRKGETPEIRVSFAEDYRQENLAGKTVDFKVDIQEIKVLELPELNDDFVKDLGSDFKDLEDLRTKIREDLITREEKRVDRDVRTRLMKTISDRVDFELPESLVESETNFAIENIRRNFMRSGSDLETAGITEEKMRTDFRPASERRVKDMLILGEIANQNDLTISEEDLNDGFREMAEGMGQDPQVVRSYYEASQALDTFRDKLLEEKTLKYLVEGATIKEVNADELIASEPEKE